MILVLLLYSCDHSVLSLTICFSRNSYSPFSRESFQANLSTDAFVDAFDYFTSYRLSSITNFHYPDIIWWMNNWNEVAWYFMREIQLSVNNCIFIDTSMKTVIEIHNRVLILLNMLIIAIIICGIEM